jgi:hypothetical protein
MKQAVAIGLLALSACASPGDTVTMVSSSPVAATFEYSHSYSFELGETIKVAEKVCGYYKRHAVLVGNTQINLDRSIATFRCVPR